MKTVSLSGSLRGNVGKKDAKSLRKEGNVPAVLYGGNDQLHIKVEAKALDKLIFTPEVFLIDMDIDGDKRKVIIKDIQYHPVTDEAIHVDFLQIFDDKPVTIQLPVSFVGRSPGVAAGGKLSQHFRKLTVRGLAGDMPEMIEVDLSKLQIGDAVRVRDISLDGLEMKDAHPAVIVAVKMARGASKDAEEEEAEAEEEGATEEAAAE